MSEANQGFSIVSEGVSRLGEKILVDPEGRRVIASSRRPDGSLRKEIKIRPGYVRHEEREKFMTKGTEFRQRVEQLEKYPVGWQAENTSVSVKKKQQKKKKNAAQISMKTNIEISYSVETFPTDSPSTTDKKCDQSSQEPSFLSETCDTERVHKQLKSIQKKLQQVEQLEKQLVEKKAPLSKDQLNKITQKESLLKKKRQLNATLALSGTSKSKNDS